MHLIILDSSLIFLSEGILLYKKSRGEAPLGFFGLQK